MIQEPRAENDPISFLLGLPIATPIRPNFLTNIIDSEMLITASP